VIRIILLILCVLAVSSPAFATSPVAAHRAVLHQEIGVTLIPADHLLVGESTITVAAGSGGISLQLSPTAVIETVTVAGSKHPFTFSNGKLSLDIPASAEAEAIPVTVVYRGHFNDPLPLNPGTSEDPTYGVTGAITVLGTFLSDAAGWYPAPESLPLTRSTRISAPAGSVAITFGKRMQRSTQSALSSSSWEEAHPVGGLSLCAGPFQIEERREAGIDLYTYFYPENAALSGRYLDAAVKYLRVYRELFGPYPFEKFAVVENFFPTGYGFPSFTLLGSSIIRLPFIIDTSFPHELAHSWWGNAIQVDQSEGNWAEGLVTYLADYLMKEQRSAAEGRDYRRQLLADFATLVTTDTDFPLSAFVSRVDPQSRAIGYGKSAMLFHMIRSEIGDRAFFSALRTISVERRYQTATWSDLIIAFSRSSGRDMNHFAMQWLSRPGGPRVAFSNVTRRREGSGWTISGTVVQSPSFYELQLPLLLETDGPSVRTLLPLASGTTRFTLTSATEPRRLLLDPDAEIFRVLDPDEIPATVNSIKGSKQLIAVMTDDCRATEATFKRLLESLGRKEGVVIREDKMTEEMAGSNDLLLCGVPKQRGLLPRLPSGVTLGRDEFSLNNEVIRAPDGLLFLALQFPASKRFAALFQPLSEAAAGQYLSKITHYGTYGSLVFSGGGVRHKEKLPSPGGGSSIDF
jgi:hypothetical protein